MKLRTLFINLSVREVMSVERKNHRPTKKNKTKDKEKRISVKEKFAEILDLPKEIVMNIPKMTLIGSGDLFIENYKGIIEYENNRIRINTGAGVIKVTGSFLAIKEITSEDIMVSGDISSLEFQR